MQAVQQASFSRPASASLGWAPRVCRVKVQGLGARPSSCRPSEAPTLPANALSRSACTVVAAAEDVGVSRRSALFGAGLASGALLLSLPESSKAESEDSSTSDLVREISPSQVLTLSQRIESMPLAQRNSPSTPRLIDIRTPEEYKSGHVPNTVNVSYTNDEEFEQRIMPTLKGVDKSTIIVLVCASTKRSVPAVKVLQHAGFKNAMQLAKGMKEYSSEGLPVVLG